MAQDTSGTSIVTNAMSSSRTPSIRLLVDWANVGFANVASWTDESQYVLSARGEMQALDYGKSISAIGAGVSNVVYVTCRNPKVTSGGSGFRFSASNANGPLYAYIGDGKIHMTRAIVQIGLSGEYLRQITGYIVDAPEDYANRQVIFEIRDRAVEFALSRHASTLFTNTTAKAYLQYLCGILDKDLVATSDQQFDNGLVEIEYAYLDNERVWEEMGLVAEAQAGRIWFDKDGDLHFDDGAHFVKPGLNAWDDPTISQATLSTADFLACNPRYPANTVYNHIQVEYQPRYIAIEQNIYTASETNIIPASGTREIICEFTYPVDSIITPVPNTDYVAVTSGGTNITSGITIKLTSNANQATLTISNNNAAFAAYLVKLELRGYPLLSEQPSRYEIEDATSIAQYGRRTYSIRNPYVQSYRHGEMVGGLLSARYKTPVQNITLRGVRGLPWLEPGDRITVEEELAGVNEDYFIGKINWSFAPNQGYTMTLELMRAADLYPHTDYFVIGTSRYGMGTGRGRLFW